MMFSFVRPAVLAIAAVACTAWHCTAPSLDASTTSHGPNVEQVNPVSDTPALEDNLIAALRERSHVLNDAGNLDPLLSMIGKKRAVLLGEASHGTEEYYTWRARISKRLIAEKDFRFIAVEGDWGAAMAVNRYVKHMDGSAETAREALDSFTRWPTWLWNNQAILELAEWMREHNANLPEDRRVGFYGIDVYGMSESLEKVPRHVARLNDAAADQVNEKYNCFRAYADDVRRYLFRVQAGRSCEQEIASVVQLLRENHDEWSAQDRAAYFHAKQNALVVKNAERHYRTMIYRDHQSWNARARHFHLTLERLLDLYGESSRGIVWAHNTHIGDARATPMAMQRQVNIGQLARESLGRENIALIGFSTYRGEVVAGAQWEAPRQIMPVARARAGSLEHLLMRVREEPFLFIVDDVRNVPGIDRRIGHRAIGVTFNPQQEPRHYVPTILTERYDAFIFIPETTALREVEAPSNDE
jgi:erythromycin esterase